MIEAIAYFSLSAHNLSLAAIPNESKDVISEARYENLWSALAGIGATGSMIVTIVMAGFAWKAWNTSKAQIAQARDLASEEKRWHALQGFLEDFTALAMLEDTHINEEEVNLRLRNANLKATIWAINYPNIAADDCLKRIATVISAYVEKKRSILTITPGSSYKKPSAAVFMRAVNMTSFLMKILDATIKTAVDLHMGNISESEARNKFKEIEKF